MKKVIIFIISSFFVVFCFAADVEGIITNASCGLKNGELKLLMNGGTAPYTFKWTGINNFTSTDQDITNLVAGNYQVEITDALCGKATLNFTINNTGINLKERISGVCGTNSDGMIEVTGIDGVAPYQYKWSNGATDAQVFGLAKGTYSVTVTDAKNCMTTKSFGITDRVGAITPTAQNGCGDDKGSISLTVEAQSDNLSYKWQGENTGFSATTKNISNLKQHFTRLTQRLAFSIFLQKMLKKTKQAQR